MYTRLSRAAAHAYLAAELRPGEPVRLACGYLAPADGVHTFVVELETEACEPVTLPVYVPAAVFLDYDAFVLLVLEQTGEMFCCEAVEREHRAARQRSAWRSLVARALAGRAATSRAARSDDERPQEGRA